MMGHFNGILFHNFRPANKQHTIRSINQQSSPEEEFGRCLIISWCRDGKFWKGEGEVEAWGKWRCVLVAVYAWIQSGLEGKSLCNFKLVVGVVMESRRSWLLIQTRVLANESSGILYGRVSTCVILSSDLPVSTQITLLFRNFIYKLSGVTANNISHQSEIAKQIILQFSLQV